MKKKKRYWWISMSACGHFRTLKVKDRVPEPGETLNEKWQNCIFFDNKEDANAFLIKMKNLIKEEYPRAKDQNWYK